jgi:hypothetical protein
MKNVILWGLLLACAAYVGANAYTQYAPLARPLAEQFAERQIMKLPEDGNAYYTTVFVPASGRSAVPAWFESDPRLYSLKRQTHFTTFEADDPMYTRYKRYHGNSGKTVVLLQDPYGRVIYNSARTGLPRSASSLADAIQQDVANCHIFKRWRERRNPTPEPQPAPEPVDPDEPEFVEPEEAPGSDFPFLLAGLGLVIGLAFGSGTAYYEQYYSAEL